MPELAEVETVRSVLESELTGRTITKIEAIYPKIIEDDLDFFIKNVTNKKIVGMSRLGKYLIFILDNGSIISHLRMEGKYFYLTKGSELNKHIHVVFYLDNDYMLCYQDVRKFGRIVYKESSDLYTTEPLSGLGVDPILTHDIDRNSVFLKISKKSLPIKSILLDQSIITGLGNIYVDEVLYASHINPHRIGKTITADEVNKIVDSSIKILTKAIEYKGTTIRSYTSSLGVEGEYQQFLCVHTKSICPCCNKPLSKDKIGGRSTYFCEACQK